MQTQKVVNLVIKACFVFLVSNHIGAQTINDDYLLLNKVITLTTQKNDPPYRLLKSFTSSKGKLDRYYKFKYYGKPINKSAYLYDEETSSIIYNDSIGKKRELAWTKQYSILDSLFTKKDIEYFLQQDKDKLEIWDENKLPNKINLSNDNGPTFGNKIYKPLYSLNGKYVLMIHKSLKSFTSFFIFKKENKDWVLVDSIKNIW